MEGMRSSMTKYQKFADDNSQDMMKMRQMFEQNKTSQLDFQNQLEIKLCWCFNFHQI